MKTNRLLFFGFIGITIGIFIAINLMFRFESKTDRWYQFKQLPKNSLDIVYMGNSHNMQGVIPRVINDTIDLSGFTIGVPAESLRVTYFELIELFKTQSPKYIALETYVLDVNMSNGNGHVFAFIDGIPFSKNAFNVTMKLYKKDRAYNYFPAIRQHATLWKQPSMIFSQARDIKVADESSPEFSYYINTNGYHKNDTQIINEKILSINPPSALIQFF